MTKVKLSKKSIKDLSSLSKIKLTEDELNKFTTDMETIISSVETLQDFDKEVDFETKKSNLDEVSFDTLRKDDIGESMSQKDILFNAPHQEKGYFKVYGDIFDDDNS